MFLLRVMTYLFLLLGAGFLIKAAFGSTSEMSPEEYWGKYHQYLEYKLTPGVPSQKDCQPQYQNLIENGKISINVFLGMNENLDYEKLTEEQRLEMKNVTAVSDGIVGLKMAEHLLSPCRSQNYHACGFNLKQMNPHFILEKEIIDQNNEILTIHLNLFHTSIGRNLEDVLSPTQVARSYYVKERLKESTEKGGVFLYSGHSRYGSATWFDPAKSGLELSYHYLFRPVYDDFIERLQESKNPPKMIAFFGCTTADYYLDGVREAAPNSSVIVTEEVIKYSQTTAGVVTMINAIAGQKCKDQILFDFESLSSKSFELNFIGF